jgi:hypothetical protein
MDFDPILLRYFLAHKCILHLSPPTPTHTYVVCTVAAVKKEEGSILIIGGKGCGDVDHGKLLEETGDIPSPEHIRGLIAQSRARPGPAPCFHLPTDDDEETTEAHKTNCVLCGTEIRRCFICFWSNNK